MPKILEPLLLPQIVRARRSLEQSEVDVDLTDLTTGPFLTRDSSVSDLSTPVTPTFSLRGHSRYGSSISSTDTTSPTMRTPSNGPPPPDNIDDLYPGKRSLPDVKEEPIEREEEEIERGPGAHHDDDDDDDRSLIHRRGDQDFPPSAYPTCTSWHDHGPDHGPGGPRIRTTALSLPTLVRTRSPFEYDLSDGFVCDGDSTGGPRPKRRRGGESPFAFMATRLGHRFPTFSRHLQTRRWSRAAVAGDVVVTAAAAGSIRYPASSRASSRTSSIGHGRTGTREISSPATPRTPPRKDSVDQGHEPILLEPTETLDKNSSLRGHHHHHHDDDQGRQPTTPLLPPLMIPEVSGTTLEPMMMVQSPLQSPTVAGSPETCVGRTPSGSGRPSVSSQGGGGGGGGGTMAASHLPTGQIPHIRLADPDDEWSSRLGHANFDIHPEPYRPEVYDAEACRQLRANWEQARCNYIKHLVRTGEHYGITSKTYRLTEEKWATIDGAWRTVHEQTVSQAETRGALTLSFVRDASPEPTNVALPPLNGPRSDGKFPQLGNEDIVGPMVQVSSPLRKSTPWRRRRTAPFEFLSDVRWPHRLLRFGRATRAKFGRASS